MKRPEPLVGDILQTSESTFDLAWKYAVIVLAVVAVVFLILVLASIYARPEASTSARPTITEPVLTLPGIDVYEFNTPGQMHCVLAVDRASRLAPEGPALSCITIPSLKADPRRWQKSLPTPEQDA